MSIEDLKKLEKKITESALVRNRVKKIGPNWEGIAAYGNELGLELNEEDFQAFADEAGIAENELTEEQLETVAGVVINITVVAAGAAAVALAVATKPDHQPEVLLNYLNLIPSKVLKKSDGPHKHENLQI